MSRIGRLWNSLANPDKIPKLFSVVLAFVLLIGFIVPMTLDVNQIYPRPAPQEQINEGNPLAPYYRGGVAFETPGIVKAQFPENSASIGWTTAYMTPLAVLISSLSPYFGTAIYSSPGGLSDEVLYYVRGFDSILESTILMMSFVIASWLVINFTMNPRRIKKDSENSKNSNSNNTNSNNIDIDNVSKNDSSNIIKEDH